VVLVICVMILESLLSLLYDAYGTILDGETWIDKFSDGRMGLRFHFVHIWASVELE